MLSLFKRLAERRARAKERWKEFERRCEEVDNKYKTEIAPLPIEEAKRRADILLSDAALFQCATEPITSREREKLELLGPYLREFFERYSDVWPVSTDDHLIRNYLTDEPVIEYDGKYSSRFLAIGIAEEDNHYIVKIGEEAIRVFGPEGDGEELAYPSIYHLLLKRALQQTI